MFGIAIGVHIMFGIAIGVHRMFGIAIGVHRMFGIAIGGPQNVWYCYRRSTECLVLL